MSLDHSLHPIGQPYLDPPCNLEFWESMVVPLYNIEGIPHNVLIDPNGVVIGEGLRGEELEAKLQELLK